MRYAIIADIHANLEAFQAVLEDISHQNVTHFVCLGDVVGYNANPKECLKIVRDMNMPCVKGNHDEYCSMDGQLEGFNPNAAEAERELSRICAGNFPCGTRRKHCGPRPR